MLAPKSLVGGKLKAVLLPVAFPTLEVLFGRPVTALIPPENSGSVHTFESGTHINKFLPLTPTVAPLITFPTLFPKILLGI